MGDPDLEAIQSDSLEEFPLGLLSVPELRGQSRVPHVWESAAFLKEQHVMVTLFAELLDAELLLKKNSVRLKPTSGSKPAGPCLYIPWELS